MLQTPRHTAHLLNLFLLPFLLAVLLVASGCASEPSAAAPAARTGVAPTATAPGATPLPVAAGARPADERIQEVTRRDYVIGAGDVVRISVYQSPDLSLEARVSETGTISYPLLGSVKLGGISVAQAEKTIADGLRSGNFLKQPQVSVLLTQVRGNQASVLGMVNRPGRYPIEVTGMRMSELLAQAGGVSQGGSDIVTLSGSRDGQPFRTQIDVAGLFAAGSQGVDPVVLNGDTLYVDRMPTIYIYGEVQRPGPVRLEQGMTVMQALASGGGLTQRGTQRGMKIHRRGADGKLKVIEPRMEDSLQTGDVIYVRESIF
jgi:polysaccharide export outer membrane protein